MSRCHVHRERRSGNANQALPSQRSMGITPGQGFPKFSVHHKRMQDWWEHWVLPPSSPRPTPAEDFNSSFWALEFVLLPRSRWCWCRSPPSGGIHPSHARQRLGCAFRKFEIWTLKFLSLFFCLFLPKAHVGGGRKKKKTVAWRSVFLLWGFAPYLPWGGVEGTVQFSTDGKQQWLRTMA